MPMGRPGWPDCEVSMASTARKRTALARSLCVTAVRSASAWTEIFIGVSPRSLQAALALDELHDQRRQDQLHGEIELRAWAHDRVRARHPALRQHREQVGEVDAARILEAD